MKMYAIIPARGGSKSIPKKNIVLLNNYPLISYSIVACHLCNGINKVFVSTDDEEIKKISISFGAEVPFMRPKEYSQDFSTDIEFLKHFFDNVECEEVALIRPTTPLRNVQFMNDAINKYYSEKQNITSLRSVNEIKITPYKLYKIENEICSGFFNDFKGNKDYTNLPRQIFPKTYIGNGHIDIIKRNIINRGSVYGDKILSFIGENTIDIDSYKDLYLAQQEIKNKKNDIVKKIKEFSNV